MDEEYSEILRQLITAMSGVPVVMTLEVPWAYFTMQGISPGRDVDYIQKKAAIQISCDVNDIKQSSSSRTH
jgi:hypothetical protein